MKNIKVELLAKTENPVELIANITRKTFKENPKWLTNREANEKMVSAVLKADHSTSEHAVYTIAIKGCSRAFLTQIRTHRIASFTSSSQQYIEYEKVDYVVPFDYYFIEDKKVLEKYHETQKIMSDVYYQHCKVLSNDSARYLLSNASRVDLVITANMREWFHIIEQRTCNRNTMETQYIALMIKGLLVEQDPIFKKSGAKCLSKGICDEPEPMKCKKAVMSLSDYEFLVEQIAERDLV